MSTTAPKTRRKKGSIRCCECKQRFVPANAHERKDKMCPRCWWRQS